MNQPFEQHLNNNKEIWHELAKQGKVNREDLIKALNYTDKFSYAEQNDAVKRLNKALNGLVERNPDNKTLIGFVQGMTEASDEMIRDKVTSSFRDLDKVTESDIQIKARKLGIPTDEFREQFKTVKNRIDTEKGRERRAKEVAEMKWYDPQNWATSDYEKQRYINDPDASIIGKEGNGKWYNKGEAISDLSYGIAGAAGDMLPGWGSLVGPAVRGARDVQHKVTDSKYQKDEDEIIKNVATDAVFNALVEKTPTALLKKSDRMAKQSGKFDKFMNDVNQYNNVVRDVKANKIGTEMLEPSTLYKLGDDEIKTAIENMPDGSMKRILDSYAKDGVEKNRDKIAETLVTFQSLSDPKHLSPKTAMYQYDNVFNRWVENPKKKQYWQEQGVSDYVDKQARASSKGKAVKTVSDVLDTWQSGGGKAVIGSKTVNGRGSKPQTSDIEDIDWFKTNYSRDWEAGFIPHGKDDEPIMKAYREWKEENKKKVPSVREVF